MPLDRYHDECFVYIWRQKAPLICAAYIFPTKGIYSFARNIERYMVCTQAKCKTYLASQVLYLESHPAAERGSAQHFGPAASVMKKRWLGKDGPSRDIQPATLVLSAEAIWQGNRADIRKSDAEPEAPRTLLLPPLPLGSRGT